jgi:hypothetical protein
MSNPTAIIASVTGLIATVYIFFKAVKKFNSPCFSITISETETEDLTFMRYLAYKMTPRRGCSAFVGSADAREACRPFESPGGVSDFVGSADAREACRPRQLPVKPSEPPENVRELELPV